MPIVQLENGLKIEFTSPPTPEDVQHVVDTIHAKQQGNSFLQNLVSKHFTARIAYNDPSPKSIEYNIKDRGIKLNEADLAELNHVLMGEVGNRGPIKSKLEATTIINTALNRMKEYAANGQPKSLVEVLQMPNQYQGYLPEGIKSPDGSVKQSQYQLSKTGQLDALSKPKFDTIKQVTDTLKSGNFSDTTQNAYYYSHLPNGEIQYDNTKPLLQNSITVKK